MEKPLSSQEIESYKRRLLEMSASVADEVESIESLTLEPSGKTQGQRGDEAIEETAIEHGLDIIAAEEQIGTEVADALDRIAAGTFGKCAACGTWIARERLQIVPYARECAKHGRARAAEAQAGQ